MLVVYRKVLGFSPVALGLLFGAYALGLVPGLLLAGRASDVYGRRPLVLTAGGSAVIASALLAFGSYGFGVLLAGRLLYGLSMGCVMSPGSVWVQELSPLELGPRRATLALSAGFGVGPLVSGLVAEYAPAPTVLPYCVHALAMAVGLVTASKVPETAGTLLKQGASLESTRQFGRAELRVLAELLPAAPWAFGFAAITIAIVPGILRAHVERPVVYSAFVIVSTLLSGVLVQPLTTRFGPRADLLGLGLGALGILVAARAVSLGVPSLAFAAAILVGAGYGLVMTTGLREVAMRASKEARGTAAGCYYVLTYLGFALPFLHAMVAKKLGDSTTLHYTAATALACLFVRALIEALGTRRWA
jgi:MFS family permease